MKLSGWLVAAGAVAVLVLVDRLVARLPQRRRRARAPGHGSGGGPLGELVALFAPSARHLHEETERQKHDVVLPGDAAPGWDLDLDAGTARRPGGHGRRTLTEVAPGIWTATALRWSSLSTVVVEPDGTCLVVDPGVSPAEIAGLAGEIAARGWTVVAGFSTHPHWDHVLWVRSLGDGPRWATPAGAHAASELRDDLVAQADAESPGHEHDLTARLRPMPSGSGRLPWDGREVIVLDHGAHCRGSAVLVVPSVRVLVAGDLLSDTEVPLLDLAADDPVVGYLAALALVERGVAEHGVTVLVPGHGTVAVGAEIHRRLEADRRYLRALTGDTGLADLDARLADPEQMAQHLLQVTALREGRDRLGRGSHPDGRGSHRDG